MATNDASGGLELTGTKDENGLTLKQRLFAENYVVMLNATKAAIKAGYPVTSAHAIASENLRKPLIKAYIEKLFDAARMGQKKLSVNCRR